MTYKQIAQQIGVPIFVRTGIPGRVTYSGYVIHNVTREKTAAPDSEGHALYEENEVRKNGYLISESDQPTAFVGKKLTRIPVGMLFNLTSTEETVEASYVLGLNELSKDIMINFPGHIVGVKTGVTKTDRFIGAGSYSIDTFINFLIMKFGAVQLENFMYQNEKAGGGRPKYAPKVQIYDVTGDVVKVPRDVSFAYDSNSQNKQVNYPLPGFKVLLDGLSYLQLRFGLGELMRVDFDILVFTDANVSEGKIQVPIL